MLESQTLEIPLVRGPDTKTDSKLMDSQRLVSLVDGTFDGFGSITKAPGRQILASEVHGVADAIPPAGQLLATHQGQLLELNRNAEAGTDTGRTYSLSAINDRLIRKGHAKLLLGAKKPLVHNEAAKNFDADYFETSGGVGFLVFSEGVAIGGANLAETLYLSVFDVATGAVYQDHTLLSQDSTSSVSGSFGPRLLTFGGLCGGLLYRNEAGDLIFRSLDEATPGAGVGAEVVVVSDLPDFGAGAACYFDAFATVGSQVFIAYYDIATTEGKVLKMDVGDGSVTIAPVVFVAGVPLAISVAQFYIGGPLCIAFFVTGTGLRVATIDMALTTPSVITADGVAASCARTALLVSGDNMEVFYDNDVSGSASHSTSWVEVSTAPAVITGAAVFARFCGLAAQPFRPADGYRVVPCVRYSATQPTLFLFRAPNEVHGRFLVGKAAGALDNVKRRFRLPQAAATPASVYEFRFVASELGRYQATNGASTSVVQLSRIAVTSLTDQLAPNINFVELDGHTYFSGATPFLFDGLSLVEQGWNSYPDAPDAASPVADTGAGNLSAGTYQWCQVYVWTDAQGRLHRSAPSIPLSFTLAASRKASVQLAQLGATDRRTGNSRRNVYIQLYRTTAGGTIFYRNPALLLGMDAENNADGTTLSVTDNTSDATLVANEVLYTTGGAVDHIPLPACSYVFAHQNRLFAISSEDDELAYTHVANNSIAVDSSEEFRLRVPAGGGQLTAGASMDGRLIVFREAKTYVIQGSGPSRLGGDGSYTEADPLPEDVGCVDPRSVVETPAGIMFKSARGFYLLDRSLAFQYIGADVEAYNAGSVKAAVLVSADKHVRFPLSSLVTLVFNYEFGQWAVWSRRAQDAVAWAGEVVWLKSASGFLLHDFGFKNEGVAYSMSLETTWIKLAGVAGFQRVREFALVGEAQQEDTPSASVSVLLSCAYDYDENAGYSDSVSGAISVAGSGVAAHPTPLMLRHRMARQKCTAIKIRFSESTTSERLRIRLSLFRLEIGVKRGSAKLPATRTV